MTELPADDPAGAVQPNRVPDLGDATAAPAQVANGHQGDQVGDDPAEGPHTGPGQARRPSTARSLIEWFLVIGGALGVALLVNAFLFQPFRIPSASMYPTLKVGDRVVVNKLSYDLHAVHRGDVVVFGRPRCAVGTTSTPSPTWANCFAVRDINDLIKRVVAVGGDTISIHDDKVFIDGRALDEPYVRKGAAIEPRPLGCGFPGTYKVPSGDVFVMGDNRDASADSRCFGPIPKSSIVGRAFVRMWPPSRLGGL